MHVSLADAAIWGFIAIFWVPILWGLFDAIKFHRRYFRKPKGWEGKRVDPDTSWEQK